MAKDKKNEAGFIFSEPGQAVWIFLRKSHSILTIYTFLSRAGVEYLKIGLYWSYVSSPEHYQK